jgi:2-C-methyl-D-erythritol 4-phosphate cytidylyltransferase/2-C-methyl-D-erythritol 2,4-cyclodiphosphate synthase
MARARDRRAAGLQSREFPVHVSAIIAAGGRGARFGGARPKQLLTLRGVPILQHSVVAFVRHPTVDDVVVALPAEILSDPPAYLLATDKPISLVPGGPRRQDSVAQAFARVAATADIVVVHDAARPLVSATVISRTIAAAAEHGAAVAALRATDTVKRGDAASMVVETVRREDLYLVQTPQAFRTDVLRDALAVGTDATDEAGLAERAGHRVHLVDGDRMNMKITTADDLVMAERWLAPAPGRIGMRIGNGYDLHRLVAGRVLILGGVTIPFEKGLLGHSDADIVCHALTDAVLGAAGAGDIGRHFPDTDPTWKGADSLVLLRRAVAMVRDQGFRVVNVDVTVVAQAPKLSPFVDAMRTRLAEALACDTRCVSVKGKTNEGVDSIGAAESMAAHAVALLVCEP